MKQILKKLNVLLDKKQKRTMGGLMVLMIIGAALQTAGVGMLVQVVTVVMDPAAPEKSSLVGWVYESLGFQDYGSFSVAVMAALILVFAVKNLFLFIQQKLTFAFVYANQFRTSERMMCNYLRRGYEYYLSADTAVVQRSITSDVNNMYALILALLQLMSDGVVSLFIVCYCLSKSGVMTILLAVVLVALMAVIKKVLKPIMYKAGKDNQDYYSGLFKWISQTVQLGRVLACLRGIARRGDLQHLRIVHLQRVGAVGFERDGYVGRRGVAVDGVFGGNNHAFDVVLVYVARLVLRAGAEHGRGRDQHRRRDRLGRCGAETG